MFNANYWLKNPTKIVARVRYWFYERKNSELPWLCPGTNRFLDSVLTTEMTGVEFGSGRSTHWFAKRLKQLISIEHVAEWYAVVEQQIASKSLTNVDYRLIPLEHEESEPEQKSYSPLPRYVGWLTTIPDESFDFVLVDGHYRTNCIRTSLSKIKVGGVLVVDDVEMWYQTNGPPVPKSWVCIDASTNGLKTTQIWKRV